MTSGALMMGTARLSVLLVGDGVAQRLQEGNGLLAIGIVSACFCLPLAVYAWNTRSGERAFGLGRMSTRTRRSLSAGLLLVPIALFSVGLEPYVEPERYIPKLEHSSAPLVAALDRFTEENGAPPAELDELVPGYLSAIPETGYRGDFSFHYSSRRPSPSNTARWELYVSCEALPIFYCDMLRIVSTDRRWRWIDDRD